MVRMAEPDDTSNWQSSATGEKGYKEARDRIAARNADARKAGKQARAAYERERASMRRAAESRGDAGLTGRRSP